MAFSNSVLRPKSDSLSPEDVKDFRLKLSLFKDAPLTFFLVFFFFSFFLFFLFFFFQF